VLLPVPFYLDGAMTRQFDHLPVEALKFALGTFNGTARHRKFTWRELGCICHFLAVDTEKKDPIRNSKHMDNCAFVDDSSVESSDFDHDSVHLDVNEDAGTQVNDANNSSKDDEDDAGPKIESCVGQVLHEMLAKFLESYKELEQWVRLGTGAQRQELQHSLCSLCDVCQGRWC